MVQVEVVKTGSENPLSVIRKFSRRVQGTGIVQAVRKGRYYARPASKTVRKKQALKRIKKQETYRKLVKEGKIAERAPRRGSRGAPSASREAGASPARFGEATPIAR
ncbi:hypothetical protein COU20_01230 [Candidatus Kaiserbacteria bacterium CG10_big_fil_rev_8_21_14_0_10_59_10]|uniref:Small ribosomal subunit protein bS21 n=1 Tax=Candidatus Kaiserbacteria bacterium CG10_big_fil_rev_8_21_14_0_10_59_10 TaxID=1974612 RepID=A0A2H0U8C1_9BACT|nr:MAG: hypothetical protein COU20_01230 [Candidatus Kaiserbacteria bacterium CG10_big_fil_rev_8_21_14_0_10_59_10]